VKLEMPEELKKRTHVYVMRPIDYEISGCKCGNDDPDWSEYEHHLWCQKCLIDFIPERDGIFDGPIPVNAMRLLGIPVDRYNIATGEIEKA
jgi:hypothetical protein